jgi:hypothetical protein
MGNGGSMKCCPDNLMKFNFGGQEVEIDQYLLEGMEARRRFSGKEYPRFNNNPYYAAQHIAHKHKQYDLGFDIQDWLLQVVN